MGEGDSGVVGDWDIGKDGVFVGDTAVTATVAFPAQPTNKTAKTGKRSHRFMLSTIPQIAYSQLTKRLTTDGIRIHTDLHG